MFQDFDFQQLYSPDFKEDSVREVLVLPIIHRLGYKNTQVVRSKTLQHPFLKTGSTKRPVNLVPDYLFKVEDSYAWVLDAKSPTETITSGDNLEQIYSYAIHPEVRTKFFSLCNGKEFILFRQDEKQPILYFQLQDIENYWDEMVSYLSPSSFQSGKNFTYTSVKKARTKSEEFDYANRPLLEELPVYKQSAKRHFGVHGYFTKQVWNVVQEYIRNFSQVGDVILDPFGGSGVTAIEALITDRKAIHVDLNPMSVFMVNSLIAPVDIDDLNQAFTEIKTEYLANEPKTDSEIAKALKKYPYPQNLSLPKGSDVESIEQLFTSRQLAQLAYLKSLIVKQKDKGVRQTLLLMFSGLLNKVNLTYHASEGRSEGRGNSSVFAYYRYRIAKDPAFVDVITYYESRLKKVIAAKKEMEPKINNHTISNAKIVQGSATNLRFIKNESVDYIYTDPPYGKKIPYLDLSVMWNGWLDLPVTEEDYAQEAIEGGEHNKTKDEYNGSSGFMGISAANSSLNPFCVTVIALSYRQLLYQLYTIYHSNPEEPYNELIAKSIQEMYRVLKFDRWMSFVFAHKDPEFWHLIIETAEKCGLEYAGAVKQGNGQTSFKKRQNPFTVLSGQLIINFRKVRKPKYIMKAALGMNTGEIIIQTCEGIIAKNNGATLEQINDELIIKGLELGFLDLLKKEYSDLTPFLLDTFDYDEKTELFTIRKDQKFKTHVDLNLRVKYYLYSYLRRQELENKLSSFDQIVLHILPLLKNGITPEKQTILNVLEDIAEPVGTEHWRLKQEGQLRLFI